MRKLTILATLAGALTASAAMAEEHVVLIMDEEYFPDITYVDSGDTIRFINTTGVAHNIISENDEWAVGPIAPGGEASISVTSGMKRTFFNADAMTDTDADGADDTYTVAGDIDFGAAPLN